MPNVLFVTIDHDAKPPCLDIDEKGDPNRIKRKPDWQTIRWKLHGNAVDASFNAIADPKAPAFVWTGIKKPPTGIFSAPVLRHHGKVLTIGVLNDYDPDDDPDSVDTTGEWPYQLSVTVCGETYQSIVTRTTTNPRIKNT